MIEEIFEMSGWRAHLLKLLQFPIVWYSPKRYRHIYQVCRNRKLKTKHTVYLVWTLKKIENIYLQSKWQTSVLLFLAKPFSLIAISWILPPWGSECCLRSSGLISIWWPWEKDLGQCWIVPSLFLWKFTDGRDNL